jgi:hypothetical protein
VAAEKGQASAKNYLNQGNRDVPAINLPKRLRYRPALCAGSHLVWKEQWREGWGCLFGFEENLEK